MGRIPHGAWNAGWGTPNWPANWPAILLLGIVGLILLVALIAALMRKKPGDILPGVLFRVPFADVFEEERETRIIVELPGVTEAEISIAVDEEMVTVETTGARKFAKDIVLEEAVDASAMRKEYRDGLLTLWFARPAARVQPGSIGSATPAVA